MKESAHPRTRGWRWAQVPQRAVAILREEGLKSLWVKLLDKTLCRWEVLIEHPLDRPVPEISAQVPLEIGLLDGSEVEEYVHFRPGTDPSEITRRLTAGHWCFVARHKGHMIYAS